MTACFIGASMKGSIGRRCTLVSSRPDCIALVNSGHPAHSLSSVQAFMATDLHKVLTMWHVPVSANLLCMCSSGEQHACCYCFRKGLIRKAHLCHNTKKWAAKHPGGWLAKSVPESFIFELDDIDYIEEALCDVPEVCTMHNRVYALASGLLTLPTLNGTPHRETVILNSKVNNSKT